MRTSCIFASCLCLLVMYYFPSEIIEGKYEFILALMDKNVHTFLKHSSKAEVWIHCGFKTNKEIKELMKQMQSANMAMVSVCHTCNTTVFSMQRHCIV